MLHDGHEDDYDDYDDDENDDESPLGQFVLACRTDGCLMPGPHFTSECHTVFDVEESS